MLPNIDFAFTGSNIVIYVNFLSIILKVFEIFTRIIFSYPSWDHKRQTCFRVVVVKST